jgi:plasmid stability protein
MASITIRNLDNSVKQNLRVQAARHGRSMEEEARVILTGMVAGAQAQTQHSPRTMSDVLREIDQLVEQAGGFEIELVKEPSVDFSVYETMHSPELRKTSGKAA